jgi:competence protein ComEA
MKEDNFYNIKKLFDFTPGERYKIRILLGIIVGFMLIQQALDRWYQGNPQLSQEDIDRLRMYLVDTSNTVSIEKAELFDFDPNSIGYDDLIRMGWGDYPANNLINFRNKGGQIKTKEKIKTIYGMTTELYDRIEPHIKLPIPEKKDYENQERFTDRKPEKRVLALSAFDPNVVSKEDLTAMGIPNYPASSLISFRNTGFVFSQKSDVYKIYGMTDSLYALIEPFIHIPDSILVERANKESNYKNKDITTASRVDTINLNKATVEELVKLKGIGKVMADVIINYREKLGGYYSAQQLYDIKYLKPEVIESILPYLIVDNNYKRWDLKDTNFIDFLKHPYTNRESTNILIRHFKNRDQKTELDNFYLDERFNASINRDTLQKLKPYLQLN